MSEVINKENILQVRKEDEELFKQIVLELRNLISSKETELDTKVDDSMKITLVQETTVDNLLEREDERKIIFYSQVVLAAYNNQFNTDKNNYKEGDFGFSELIYVIKNIQDSKEFERFRKDDIQDYALEFSLRILSQLSTKPFSELTEEEFNEDMAWVYSLVDTSIYQDEKEKEIFEIMKEDNTISDAVNMVKDAILKSYDRMFSSGFELEPFPGVLTISKTKIRNKRGMVQEIGAFNINRNAVKVSPIPSLKMTVIGDVIWNNIKDLEVDNESRQWNIEAILDNPDTVIYHPFKIIEYAYGRKSTYHQDKKTYEPFKGRGGWKPYRDGYVDENIEYFLYKSVKVTLERLGRIENNEVNKDIPLVDLEVLEDINNSLNAMKNSMITAFFFSELESTGPETWSSYNLRYTIVDLDNDVNYINEEIIDKAFMGVVSQNEGNAKIQPASVEEVSTGIHLVNAKHVFNRQLANKRPLFAYKALDTVQANGENLKQGEIILGKNTDGTILISKEHSKVDLSRNLFHFIIAGSRAGKGVMTLNPLANYLGFGRPVFYLDRKPDMASMLAEKAGKTPDGKAFNMFIVNGGAYEREFDGPGLLESPIPDIYQNVPDYLGITDDRVVGDMAYLRGLMLAIGVIYLRGYARGLREDPDNLYEKLNGNQGVAIVIDEFTNFQSNFTTTYLNPSHNNTFFTPDNLLTDSKVRELEKAKEQLDEMRVKLDRGGILTDANVINVDKHKDTIRNFKNFKKEAYFTDLVGNLNDFISDFSTAAKASLEGKETRDSDIFIIGQNLEYEPFPYNNIGWSGGKKEKLISNASMNSKCVVFKALRQLSGDFFMGYNMQHPEYMHANQDKEIGDALSMDARNFAYTNLNIDDVKGKNSRKEGVPKIKNDSTFFKPFLILNAADEPEAGLNATDADYSAKPEYQYVHQLAKNSGDLWPSIRQENLDRETGYLRKEIGFFPYIEQFSGNSDYLNSMKKSADIAQMIVDQMGYEGTWLEFIYDFRPEWLFSPKDIQDAFENPELFKSGVRRHPNYNSLFDEENEKYINSPEYDLLNKDSMNNMSEDERDGFRNNESLNIANLDKDEFIFDEEDDFNYTTDDINQLYQDIDEPFEDFKVNVDENNQPKTAEGVEEKLDIEAELERLREIEKLYKLRQANPDLNSFLDNPDNLDLGSDMVEDIDGNKVKSKKIPGTINLNQGFDFDTSDIDFNNVINDVDYYENYYKVRELITQDILKTFGGPKLINKFVVKGNAIYINNVHYARELPNELIKKLPLDKQLEANKQLYGSLFNFKTFFTFTNIKFISFDDYEFITTYVKDDLGWTTYNITLNKFFEEFPSLEKISIEGKSMTKEESFEEPYNIFSSKAKRKEVSSSFNDWVTGNSKRSFNKAKQDIDSGSEAGKQARKIGWMTVGLGLGAVGAVYSAGRSLGNFLKKLTKKEELTKEEEALLPGVTRRARERGETPPNKKNKKNKSKKNKTNRVDEF